MVCGGKSIVINIDYRKIDNLVNKHLTAFLGEEKHSMNPIDIDRFIQEYLGMEICYRKLSEHGDILGVSIFSDMTLSFFEGDKFVEEFYAGGTIIIEEDLLDDNQYGRRNFTKAHEAAHGILNFENPTEKAVYYRRNNNNSFYEKLIDKAAAKLLLPDELVIKTFYAFMGTEHIHRLNPLCNQQHFKNFKFLARYLGVSRKALSLRLLQLGLVDVADYEIPHNFLNISCEGDII